MPTWPFIRRNRHPTSEDDIPLCALPRRLNLDHIKRVLVFAPHPDDESLACGGTLAQLAESCAIQVVLVTDGSGAGGLPAGAASLRQAEFAAALDILGIQDHVCLEQPDGGFAGTPALAERIRGMLEAFRPDHVFLPAPIDYHRDHLRIAEFLTPLCRRCPTVEFLVHYEVWAPVLATHVVDITAQWDRKVAALSAHKTAMACGDYLAAIQGLNRYRGLYVGRDRMAEAFWVEHAHQKSLFSALLACSLRVIQSIRA